MRRYVVALAIAILCVAAWSQAQTTPSPDEKAALLAEVEALRAEKLKLMAQIVQLQADLVAARKTIATLNAKLASLEPKADTTPATSPDAEKPADKPMRVTEFLVEAHKYSDEQTEETAVARAARQEKILTGLIGRRLELTGVIEDVKPFGDKNTADVLCPFPRVKTPKNLDELDLVYLSIPMDDETAKTVKKRTHIQVVVTISGMTAVTLSKESGAAAVFLEVTNSTYKIIP